MSQSISRADAYFVLKPSLIGVVEALSITILALGIMAALSVPGVNALRPPLQITFIVGGGAGVFVGGVLFFTRVALKGRKEETRIEQNDPSIVHQSEVKPHTNIQSLQLITNNSCGPELVSACEGLLERAHNFCYADSLIFAVFMGCKSARIALENAVTRGDKSEAQKKIMGMLGGIVKAISKGETVPKRTMEFFQEKLCIDWQGSANQDQHDSASLFRYFDKIIEFPPFKGAMSDGEESIYKNNLDSSLEPEKKLSLQNRIIANIGAIADNLSTGNVECKIQLPSFFLMTILRDKLSAETCETNPVLLSDGEIDLSNCPVLHPDDANSRVLLTGIVCHMGRNTSGHYWSFYARDAEGKWKKFDDLHQNLVECSFDEVKSIGGRNGRLLFFEKQAISN